MVVELLRALLDAARSVVSLPSVDFTATGHVVHLEDAARVGLHQNTSHAARSALLILMSSCRGLDQASDAHAPVRTVLCALHLTAPTSGS